MEIFISWAAVILILLAAALAATARDWRFSLGVLALHYLAAFWLTSRHLPFVMASAKLITGWMVVAVLGMTRLGLSHSDLDESTLPRGRSFRLILLAVAAFVSFGASPRVEASIPGIGLPVVMGCLLLIGAGLMQISITSDALNVILGLLTMLAGFEIVYAAVENSILVTGLLALVNLGLGLSGAYLLFAGSIPFEVEEESI